MYLLPPSLISFLDVSQRRLASHLLPSFSIRLHVARRAGRFLSHCGGLIHQFLQVATQPTCLEFESKTPCGSVTSPSRDRATGPLPCACVETSTHTKSNVDDQSFFWETGPRIDRGSCVLRAQTCQGNRQTSTSRRHWSPGLDVKAYDDMEWTITRCAPCTAVNAKHRQHRYVVI